jgi:hypothetical protein
MGRTNRLRAIVPHPSDPSVALVQLTRGYWAIIDAADSSMVGEHNWTTDPKSATLFYAKRRENGKTVFLHRAIADQMGLPSELVVDHINGNGLDCRRSNLRSATKSQNQFNRRLDAKSRSGIKGVTWDASRNKWSAGLSINDRRINLGRFDSVADAAAAVRAARPQYHGEFTNHGSLGQS